MDELHKMMRALLTLIQTPGTLSLEYICAVDQNICLHRQDHDVSLIVYIVKLLTIICAGVSFARDFLEMEQTVRSDSNIAYDIKEFTSKSTLYPST